jgi:hypothetical protein
MALGCTDISNVKAGEFNLRTTAGNQDIPPKKCVRFMMWDIRPWNEYRDFANQVLGPDDYLVMHNGPGENVTQAQIDTLNGITVGIPKSHMGWEFFNLVDIENNVAAVANAGFGFISFDLEGELGVGPSYDAELNDPLAAHQQAKATCDAHGLKLHTSIAQRYYNTAVEHPFLQQMAELLDCFHMQTQVHQGNDANGDFILDFCRTKTAIIKAANPNCTVTYQLTLTASKYIAPGHTTLYDTCKMCIDRVSAYEGADAVNGLAIWFNGAAWDNGEVKDLYSYHKAKYGGLSIGKSGGTQNDIGSLGGF